VYTPFLRLRRSSCLRRSQLEKKSIFQAEWLYRGIAHIILIVRAFFGIVVAKQSCQQSKKHKRATPPYQPLPAQIKAEKAKNRRLFTKS